jgi:hypothetical protein
MSDLSLRWHDRQSDPLQFGRFLILKVASVDDDFGAPMVAKQAQFLF